jgi:2-polyprenyl-6-methoxyphenol hydroxylase-like FAD-dependent oxidoreductase
LTKKDVTMNRSKPRGTPDSDYDVVVVGGRCAGAATAMLLARAGVRVALVDRAPEGSDTLSTHALMRAGVIQLHQWGLLDRVIAAGTPAVRQTVFRYGQAVTTVSLKRLAGIDALYAPRRTVLDPILVHAAGEAGADVLFGISVTDVERGTDGRVIGVVGHDGRGSAIRLRAAMTIWADGLRSTVARAVGATLERRASHASSFIYAYISGLESSGYEWHYGAGVSAALIPTNDEQTCISVGAPPARFRSELARDIPAGFRRLLGEVSPDLAERVGDAGAPVQLRSFPGVRGFMLRPWGPGWALVGDSGYFKDPITAHGISDALRDAQLLANAAAAFLFGHVNEEAAMREYHETRNRLSLQMFTVTDTIASYRWDTGSVETHLRSLSAAMVAEIDHLLAGNSTATMPAPEDSVSSAGRRLAIASRGNGRSEGQP